jgi:hypothetical protein
MDDKEREQEILDAIEKLMEVSEHQEVIKEHRRLKEELAAIPDPSPQEA